MAVKCSNRTLWTTADEDGYPYWVEFEDRPFTKGNSKYMYKGRLNGKGPRSGDYCTVKVFRNIDIARHDDWSLYISRAETANKLAAQFNKMLDNQYRVKFLVPVLALVDISSTCTDCIYFLSNTKRIRPDDSVAIEPYIGSKFRKFYRNSPLKGAEHAYVLQAFSHFTASQTGDTLICGMQGEAHGTEFVLTNPIIHSANQQWGPKDQGPHGFRKFFSAHTCNVICRSMDLPDYLETMSVTEEIDHGVFEATKSVEETEQETSPKQFASTENLEQTTTQAEVSTLPQAEAQISEPPSDFKATPAILQTPPMSHVGRTIVAPVSMEISLSRSSSVAGPPAFAEDIPGESISRPPAESEILDATPFDDITTQLSDTQEVLPPPSSEYLGPFSPCRTVSEYLELKKNFAPFSPGSESIPMIDDDLACVESEFQEAVPPPCEDFEPTLSPSLNSYLKDRESIEIIPHGSMDLDSESQQSISFFDDNLPAPDLGSMNNFQMIPNESITQDVEMFESLVNTPCGTMSQESLVTTPCGSIRQEIESQPSVVSTPKDSVSQDLIPVSEPPVESIIHLDLPGDAEIPQDPESQVCLISIPPDSMDHHLDTIESLEALSPASEKLTSVEVTAEPIEEYIEPGAGDVEEQISAQEFSETQTIQDTGTESFETYPLDNVEVGVQKSLSVDTISDFKQSLETIPEGSNESDSAQSLDISEMPTERIPDEAVALESSEGVVDNQTVVASDVDFSGQEETSGIQSGPMFETPPETVVTEETMTSQNFVSENMSVEPNMEIAGDAGVCQETAVEESVEATVAQDNTIEPTGESIICQEATVGETSIEPVVESETIPEPVIYSQETFVEPVAKTISYQETSPEPVTEAVASQETTIETTEEPVAETITSQETSVEPVSVTSFETTETSFEPAAESITSQEMTSESVPEGMTYQETTVEKPIETVFEEKTSQETTTVTSEEVTTTGEVTNSQETNIEPVSGATFSQGMTVETSAEPMVESTTSQETIVGTSVEPTISEGTTDENSIEPMGESTTAQETTVETTVEPMGESTTAQETTVETTVEPMGESTTAQETTVETSVEPMGESTTAQETTVETTVEPMGESTTAQEATVETTVEPMGESTTAQETTVETTVEPMVESTTAQETTVETTIEPMGESTTAQETTVETTIEPMDESTTAQETTVETTVEPMGESTTAQETTVETTVEPMGESTTAQETTVETTVEPMGESTTAQETTVETTVEPMGESTTAQETTVETTVEPMVESTTAQETAVETTVEPMCESTTAQETTVETTVEPMGESTTAQETMVETAVEPMGEYTAAQETTVETTVEPMAESTTAQETTVETTVEPMGESTTSQETTVETTFEPIGESTTTQETTVETTVEPVCESMAFQETDVGGTVGEVTTTVEPVGEGMATQESIVETAGNATTTVQPVEAMDAQETIVQTSVTSPVGETMVTQEITVTSPVGEAMTTQETVQTFVEPLEESITAQKINVETSEPINEPMTSQETTVEAMSDAAVTQVSQEPGIEKTTIDSTEQCYTSEEKAGPDMQESYVCQQTTVESTGGSYDVQEGVAESIEITRESNIKEDAASGDNISQDIGSAEGNVYQGTSVESTFKATGDDYACQDAGSGSTAVETVTCQETADGSAIRTTSDWNVYQDSRYGTIGEGYVCQDSAGETTFESSKMAETSEGVYINQNAGFDPSVEHYMSQNIEIESNVEASADGYTSQDSGFGSVVDTNPAEYSHRDQSFAMSYDNDPGSNTYSQAFETETSSYLTENRTGQTTDPCYYGLPPEYQINEASEPSGCEAGSRFMYPKMTIIPDLDTMEFVETKRLDSVCEKHDTQQGIETLPRRKVSYYLEPKESHEIITFRINISPENPNESIYQNVGSVCQGSSTGESGVGSTNFCSSSQSRETSENVPETSGQDTQRSSSFYSYRCSSVETIPQRNCGYNSDVHQNVSTDWSSTRPM